MADKKHKYCFQIGEHVRVNAYINIMHTGLTSGMEHQNGLVGRVEARNRSIYYQHVNGRRQALEISTYLVTIPGFSRGYWWDEEALTGTTKLKIKDIRHV